MAVERVDVREILDLRWRVLRAGLPRETALFEGDEAETSVHLAARGAGGEVIGCVTLHRRAFPAGDGLGALPPGVAAPAWQLRGMAVEAAVRGTGVGAALLSAAEVHVAAAAARGQASAALWCNARKPAVPFYERHGWLVVSEEFVVPSAGPHRRMVWTFAP